MLSSSELALTKRKRKVLGRFRKKCKLLPLRSMHFSNLCPYKSSFALMLRQALGYQPMRVVIDEVLQEALGHLMSMVQAFLLSEESTVQTVAPTGRQSIPEACSDPFPRSPSRTRVPATRSEL